MANNILYIVDTETNEKFFLAKTMGYGWYFPGREDNDPAIEQKFEEWAELRDLEASYGNCSTSTTKFILVCGNSGNFDNHRKPFATGKLWRGWLWWIVRILAHLDAKLSSKKATQ